MLGSLLDEPASRLAPDAEKQKGRLVAFTRWLIMRSRVTSHPDSMDDGEPAQDRRYRVRLSSELALGRDS